MSARIQIVAGPRDLTGAYSDLSFSNVDPGGFEQLQVTASDARGVEDGDEVVVRSGLDVAWHGRVNEIGSRERDGRATIQIAAVGYGSKLSDKRMSMIYADRDLSQWHAPSRGRIVSLVGTNFTQPESPSIASDTSTNLQALVIQHADIWAAPLSPISEPWYDAGTGNLIGVVYYDFTNVGSASTATAAWDLIVRTSSDDIFSTIPATSGDIWATVPVAGSVTDAVGGRYAAISFYYTGGAGGASGTVYSVHARNLTVYGSHGLTRRGTDPGGFYPGDIAGHAHTASGAGFEQVFGDSSTLTVRHAVYREPVRHEQVIADMAKLMGWHYGVWEPSSILSTTPRLFFAAPPAAPTCVIDRSQITDLDAPRVRVDRLYDTAKVAYQDPGGTSGVQTVTIVNPLTASAGVSGRTLDIDMGQGDSTTATTYGTFALNLALAGARGGGSGTVPDTIASTTGGRRPACLLRSGRDRIRITDLPDSGSWTETDANRQDSFLVRRVETTVKGGQPSTRIEFDGGADLLDVLNARLALAQATGSAV
jgi:hypothetical protein